MGMGRGKAAPADTVWKGEIPFAPPSANVYQRLHWRQREKLHKVWYLEVYAAFGMNTPTRATQKRYVKIMIRSKNQRDYSNQWLGADKLILDQMVKLGWLMNDDPKHVDVRLSADVGTPSRTFIEISDTKIS